MRRISKKRRELMDSVRFERAEFLLEFQRCMIPWCKRSSSDVHEIARGSARTQSLAERAAWLALCRKCHDEMGSASRWPVELQLAVKAMWDPDHLDVARVNVLRGRDPGAIDTRDMVLATLRLVRRAVLHGWVPDQTLPD